MLNSHGFSSLNLLTGNSFFLHNYKFCEGFEYESNGVSDMPAIYPEKYTHLDKNLSGYIYTDTSGSSFKSVKYMFYLAM